MGRKVLIGTPRGRCKGDFDTHTGLMTIITANVNYCYISL